MSCLGFFFRFLFLLIYSGLCRSEILLRVVLLTRACMARRSGIWHGRKKELGSGSGNGNIYPLCAKLYSIVCFISLFIYTFGVDDGGRLLS